MAYRLTFNKPAHEKWFSASDAAFIEVNEDRGQVSFKPSATAGSNKFPALPRGRGGCEIILGENGDDDLSKRVETVLNSHSNPFFILQQGKGSIISTPFTGAGDPPRFVPHIRLWSNRDKGENPRPRAASTTVAPTSIPGDSAAYEARLNEAFQLVRNAQGKVGRAPKAVVEARQFLADHEERLRTGATEPAPISPNQKQEAALHHHTKVVQQLGEQIAERTAVAPQAEKPSPKQAPASTPATQEMPVVPSAVAGVQVDQAIITATLAAINANVTAMNINAQLMNNLNQMLSGNLAASALIAAPVETPVVAPAPAPAPVETIAAPAVVPVAAPIEDAITPVAEPITQAPTAPVEQATEPTKRGRGRPRKVVEQVVSKKAQTGEVENPVEDTKPVETPAVTPEPAPEAPVVAEPGENFMKLDQEAEMRTVDEEEEQRLFDRVDSIAKNWAAKRNQQRKAENASIAPGTLSLGHRPMQRKPRQTRTVEVEVRSKRPTR